MLGILYLILSCFVGYNSLKVLVPRIFKVSKEGSLAGKTIKLSNWMVTLPASFLTGTLFATWMSYLLSWVTASIFPGIKKPLFYGDLLTFLLLAVLCVIIVLKRKEDFKLFFEKLKSFDVPTFNDFVLSHKTELIYVVICLVLCSIFMIRSFYMDGSQLKVGLSVFSDFGAHIPMIQSFSEGSNIPTEYPHYGASQEKSFSGNDIRYHFMFQFLAGNFMYLGLPIDWALNLPSILGIVSFLMLLYSFTVLVFGNRLAGIFAAVFFFFRSSFAIFNYAGDMDLKSKISPEAAEGIMKYFYMFKQFLAEVWINVNNIGKSVHDDWGFYAQKVFVNKRHYGFALGIAFLVLIIVFPMFRKMIVRLRKTNKKALAHLNSLNAPEDEKEDGEGDSNGNTQVKVSGQAMSVTSLKIQYWLDEFIFSRDAWLTGSLKRAITVGLLLGLIGFWNGAVAISMLPVLFFMAIFSKNRLEHFIIAAMTVAMVLGQVEFFTGGQTAEKATLYIGYLAEFPAELNNIAKVALESHEFVEFIKLIPDLLYYIFKFYFQILGFLPLLLIISMAFTKKGGRWLILAFLSPLIMATLVAFSKDVGANHVIVIFSVILLNIIAANLFARLFVSKSIIAPIVILGLAELAFYASAVLYKYEHLVLPVNIAALAIMIIVFLVSIIRRNFNIGSILCASVASILLVAYTSSGIVDGIALYNMDKSPGRVYDMEGEVVKWALKNTEKEDVFLTCPDFMNTIMLSGRKVFLGGNYFVYTTGYDWDGRWRTVIDIYTAQDSETLKTMVKENNIDYIVIDDVNRNSKDFTTNQELISKTFKLAFYDEGSRTSIYKVN
jgi:hypothetical protein